MQTFAFKKGQNIVILFLRKATHVRNEHQKESIFANWLIRREWFLKRKQTESSRTAQSCSLQPNPDSANRYLPVAMSIVYYNDGAAELDTVPTPQLVGPSAWVTHEVTGYLAEIFKAMKVMRV